MLSETDSDEELGENEQLETNVQETELKLMVVKNKQDCHV